MIINRINEKGQRVTICKAKDFIHIVTQKIIDNDILKSAEPGKLFPVINFAAEVNEYNKIKITQGVRLDDIDACAWFGIRAITEFNSSDLVIVCDYYGGGCAYLVSLYDGMSQEEIEESITKAVQESTEMGGYMISEDEMIYVEWINEIRNTYEVHEIEDTFTGTPSYCSTFNLYEDALELYQYLDENEKVSLRLLLVDEEGMPIYEIKSNY